MFQELILMPSVSKKIAKLILVVSNAQFFHVGLNIWIILAMRFYIYCKEALHPKVSF